MRWVEQLLHLSFISLISTSETGDSEKGLLPPRVGSTESCGKRPESKAPRAAACAAEDMLAATVTEQPHMLRMRVANRPTQMPSSPQARLKAAHSELHSKAASSVWP